MLMRTETQSTFAPRIYLSGPIEVAKQIIRQDCLREGLCVTIEPTHFIYSGGEEIGYMVGLINYPRFPSTPEALRTRARRLTERLLAGTYQHSALLMDAHQTEWITIREDAA